MGKRSLKRRIQSLLDRMLEHEAKIAEEKQKANPDEGLIHHWEPEIAAFRKSIAYAEKRL